MSGSSGAARWGGGPQAGAPRAARRGGAAFEGRCVGAEGCGGVNGKRRHREGQPARASTGGRNETKRRETAELLRIVHSFGTTKRGGRGKLPAIIPERRSLASSLRSDVCNFTRRRLTSGGGLGATDESPIGTF